MQSREFAARARGRRNVRPNSVRCAQYHESRKRARRAKAAHEYEKRHTTSLCIRTAAPPSNRYAHRLRRMLASASANNARCTCFFSRCAVRSAAASMRLQVFRSRALSSNCAASRALRYDAGRPTSPETFRCLRFRAAIGSPLRRAVTRASSSQSTRRRRARRVVARGARLAQAAANQPCHGRRQARAG